MQGTISNQSFLLFFLGIIAIYTAGLTVDIMEVDAAQYALISKEMFQSGQYLEIYCQGQDYLDKPPFLFWINQLSFSAFGIHDWSYKLGSVLFLILGIFSTYQLGNIIHGRQTGMMAAIILGTSEAWVLMANDVRTDAILASAIIFTVWQWKVFAIHRRWGNLILLSLGIAIGMLTKGPIGFIVPAIIIGGDQLFMKNWKSILNWKYFISAILILLCISPMLWGLYHQFDLHPGKIIHGEPIDSGLKFYFWTQSFGRITGESQWKNNTSIFYFIPVIGWALLPWIIFLIQSLFYAFKAGLKKNMVPILGFIFPLVALSLSQYKLPHYIFISFPFISILIGNYLVSRPMKGINNLLGYLMIICLSAGMTGLSYLFNVDWIYPIISIAIVIIILISTIKYTSIKMIGALILTSVVAFTFGNLFIYPKILDYQAESTVGKFFTEQTGDIPVAEIDCWGFGTSFYSDKEIVKYESFHHMATEVPEGYYWIHLSSLAYSDYYITGLPLEEIIEVKNYPVSRIQPDFLNPETRNHVISKSYLVKLYLPEDWN